MLVKRVYTIFPAFLAAVMLILTPGLTVEAGFFPGSEKLTIRKENEMGRDFDQLIRTQMPMVGDTYITDYVDKIVQRVVTGKRPMPFRIKSAVVANPLLNAFAIPGGYIYIFTGLIQEVTSESQLAGVIAHELGHVSQRHVAKRLEKQGILAPFAMAGMLAGLLIGAVSGGGTAAKTATAVMVGTQGVATAAMLQYSQDDEREADHVGLNSMVKAGYNPLGMPQTFEIMKKNKWYDSGSNMPAYLSTHPGLSERITYLNDRIERMPEPFRDRKDDNTTLQRVQALVRSKMATAKSALGYYKKIPEKDYTPIDYMAVGNIQNRLKARDKAEVAFEKALRLDGEDPLVLREAGIFYFKIGKHKKAARYLQKAIAKNRRDALGLFYLARLQAESGQLALAATNMRKVMELVPEDGEVHHHLGMILGEYGDVFNGNLHLAYAALYSGNMRKARYHAGLAKTSAKNDTQKKDVEELNKTIELRAEAAKKQ